MENNETQEFQYYRNVIENLEARIKNNSFESKETLNEYLNKLKTNATASQLLSSEKILALLNLYDEYHQEIPASLDLQQYNDTKLGENNYIVATKNDEVLNNKSNLPMPDEFKQIQNKLSSASTTDELANADIVFEEMKNNQKEELHFIPIQEAIEMSNINSEVLNKIKFFITNQNINSYAFRVDPNSGIFYNIESQELYEVRKKEETGEYEIYKGGEKQYTTNQTQEENQELTKDKDEEKLKYENPKVRKLIKPPENAAFINNAFIIFIISTFSILLSLILAIIIILNK